MTTDAIQLLASLGFPNPDSFRRYMSNHAKQGKYGGRNYTEERFGVELNYSDNCKRPFGLGGNVNGTYLEYRFK